MCPVSGAAPPGTSKQLAGRRCAGATPARCLTSHWKWHDRYGTRALQQGVSMSSASGVGWHLPTHPDRMRPHVPATCTSVGALGTPVCGPCGDSLCPYTTRALVGGHHVPGGSGRCNFATHATRRMLLFQESSTLPTTCIPLCMSLWIVRIAAITGLCMPSSRATQWLLVGLPGAALAAPNSLGWQPRVVAPSLG